MARINRYVYNWCRKSKRLALYMRDEWRCVYCGRDLANVKPHKRTLDHIVPVIAGGSNHDSNLVTACKKCNEHKGDRPLFAFVQTLAGKETPAAIIARVELHTAKHVNRQLARDILAGRV